MSDEILIDLGHVSETTLGEPGAGSEGAVPEQFDNS